ncbi:MAG: histidine kinase, partial [Bacteroidia bacterium]
HFVAGVIMGGISNLLIKQEKYEEAIIWADRSVIALKAVNRHPNLVFPLINKANALLKLGRASEALQSAQAGYEIMVETGQQNPLTVYYEVFAEIYEKLGNYQEANFWLKKFMALDDSLFQAENVQTMADLEAKYQNQKKETEIANQQLHILEQNNQLLKQKSWIIGLIAGLVLILGAGFAFFIWYRLKQNAILDRAVIREQQLGLNAVIEAQEMEQRRVARDLHDGIAQELVALDLGLKVVKHQTSLVAPEVSSSIENLSNQLTSTCTEVRNLAHLMLPPTLETQGLIPSLEKLVYNSLGPKGIQVKFEHNDIPVDLNDKVKLGVYRITQELLNNIIKHADARVVWVRVVFVDQALNLEIEDDGKGFDFEQARKKGSMGIMNVLSRVSFLGGEFFSFRRIPRGFVSTISIPL